jgi:hypothetical protein
VFKRVIFASFALLLLGGLQIGAAPIAVSDGTCTPKAFKPTTTGGHMNYSGEYTCGTTSHSSITLAISLQRRQPGGLWSQVSSRTDTEGPSTRNFTAVITSIAPDCRKDYRTRSNGSASPGGHSGSTNSTILSHWC